MPLPDGRRLCYITDRSGAPNLVERRIAGGPERQLTHFRDGSLFYPSMSRDGSRIAFERDFGLWTLDRTTGRLRHIQVFAPSDYRVNPEQRLRIANRVQEYAVSPDGRQIAFVAHGEVFLQTAESPEARRLTDTPQREEDIAWAPDGKSLALVSDRSGEAELYIVDATTAAVRQLTNAPARPPSNPSFSPDGNMVAFVRGASNSELCVMPVSGGPVRVLVRDPSIASLAWSPDAKWLAYARHKSHSAGSIADIFLVNVADPHAINITRYPSINSDPRWSPDGTRLFFLSNRSQVTHVYSVPLRESRASDDAEEEQERSSEQAFELKRIHLRARRITAGDDPVRAYALSPDGKTIVFTVAQLEGTDLWKIPVSGGTASRLTKSGEAAANLRFTRGGQLYYTVTCAVRRIALNTPDPAAQPVNLSAEMVVHRRLELLQLFDEAWRKMRDGFYDPRMHGCDWQEVRARYRPVVAQLSSKEEFYTLFTIALGELNASHCGISGPAQTDSASTACLGVTLDETHGGPGVRVSRVVPRSPADSPTSKLGVGEIILRVGDADIRHNEHLYDRLEGQSGKIVTLTVRAPDGKERTVRIRPITGTTLRQLIYDEWVEQREQLVEKLAGGRLTYVHLAGMGADNLERFRRAALSDMEGREGLILDLRFNGGGSIADEMFSIIQNRVFGWRTIRDDPNWSPAPLPALTRPIVVLINEASLSNAEVFPWGFRALRLGKIVGMPTYGGVIGTGSTTLIDGSTLRMPSVGSYTLDRRNMENYGCPPHIRVEHTPEDIVAGRDRQLERAIQELLRQLPRRQRPQPKPPSAHHPR